MSFCEYPRIFKLSIYVNLPHFAASTRNASALSGIAASSTLEGELHLYVHHATSTTL